MINKIDENAPEYYSLACCVSDEQADVAMAIELRKPKTAEEIAKRCGKSLEETYKICCELSDLGVCKQYTEDGKELFMVQIFAPGILEMMVGNRENLAKHPEIGKAFEEYTRTRIANLVPMLPQGASMMRVIPIESAIDGNSMAIPYEKISYYLDKYDIFSVSPCSCRTSRRVIGEGCGHLENDMCVQMGSGAEYFIKTGKARQITRKEAEEIFAKAEANGLMHQMPNIEGLGESAAICNCCSCSCFAMRVATMFRAPEACRSNFVAEINSENCVACGQCVENCPTNALKLGQKLCSSDPIILKKSKKVTDHKWSEKEWNIDFRTNREDVVETGTSPCKTKCPAHIAVQGYIKLASQGRYTEALELIKKENPLPAVCGRICPHKCESECTRGNIDEPIAIDEIKKFLADKDLNEATRFVPTKRHDYGKKIAVVGAGPAGLSCAYYLAIDGYKVTVFEKQKLLGGMLTLGIPAFRLEKDVINAEIDVLRELGVEFKTGIEVGKDTTIPQLRTEGFEGFYLAIGAQGGRKLGLDGENAKGVIAGVDFLREVALNTQEKLSGNVVVIGGGNVAIDVARTATRVGAKTVNMFCLENRQEMPALEEEIDEALSEKIVINNSWGPKRIIAENGVVKGVEFIKCVSVFDENGKFSPKYDEKDTKVVDADYVLLSVGQSIEWGKLLEGTKVELNRNKTAVADPFTYATAERDIFVGGDAFSGANFAIQAIAAGKQGAISLHRAVWEGQSLVYGRDRREYKSLNKDTAILEGYDNTQRQRPLHNAANENTFKDTRMTFTEEQLKKETQRCLGCGAVQIDEYMCIGCGQCTTKCKFEAIKLVKKFDDFAPVFEKLPIKVAQYAVKRVGKITARAVKDVFTK
ncbi:MAG: FAD-dependent oxidoreductase [Clostridia bacterium]